MWAFVPLRDQLIGVGQAMHQFRDSLFLCVARFGKRPEHRLVEQE